MNTPITISSIILFVTTIIVYIILYLIHPSWVTKSNNKGYLVRNQFKLILWSLFFGISFAIIYLIISTKKFLFNSKESAPISPYKKNLLDNYNPDII